jgi:anti-sigma regulatory factor (Ser/Thr protein kinase)
MRLGAREFLVKPFRLEELIQAIEAHDPAGDSFHVGYESGKNLVARCVLDLSAFALRMDIGPACRARIGTAVGELLENVNEHAYPDSEGKVVVEASVDRRDLVVTVADEGLGFSSGQVLEKGLASPMHDGLARAAALAETIYVDSHPGRGTRVTLRFGAYRVDFDNGEMVDLSELDYLVPATTRQILRTMRTEEAESFFQFSPAVAVVIGRFLAGVDPEKVIPQVLWS